MNGLLLIDKPKGWTSFDVVNYVRRIAAEANGVKPRKMKVGHTGTLDPAATGLLVLCVGREYTRKVPELIRHDKTYEATIVFGAKSTTGDAEGEITPDSVATASTREEVEEALKQFVGDVKQTPPIYSALKVNGKRAYDLARKGKEVKLEPRTVRIHSIELTGCTWPQVTITCSVGSGTYIRSLAEDIGGALGVGAYLGDLRRTVVDKWSIADACGPKDISIDNLEDRLFA